MGFALVAAGTEAVVAGSPPSTDRRTRVPSTSPARCDSRRSRCGAQADRPQLGGLDRRGRSSSRGRICSRHSDARPTFAERLPQCRWIRTRRLGSSTTMPGQMRAINPLPCRGPARRDVALDHAVRSFGPFAQMHLAVSLQKELPRRKEAERAERDGALARGGHVDHSGARFCNF